MAPRHPGHIGHLGHPQDRDLRSLRKIEQSIEVQLKIERHRGEQERREIDLASCFPNGHFAFSGHIARLRRTLDPEVVCCLVAHEATAETGSLYINLRRNRCVILD